VLPPGTESGKNINKDTSENIKDTTYDLRQQYYNVMDGRLSVLEFYETLAPFIRNLSRQSKLKQIIGSRNIESFDNLLINLSSYVQEFKNSDEIGNRNEAAISKRQLMSVSNHILTNLEQLNLSVNDDQEFVTSTVKSDEAVSSKPLSPPLPTSAVSSSPPTLIPIKDVTSTIGQPSIIKKGSTPLSPQPPSSSREPIQKRKSRLSNPTMLLPILGGGVIAAIIVALIAGGIIHLPGGNIPPPPPVTPPRLSISESNVVGMKVTVTGQAFSQSRGEQVTRIHFNWGDGNAANATNLPMSHNYANPGTYNIKITAYDRNGLSTTKIIPVVINPILPVTPPKHPPVANAGRDQIVNESATVKLDGTKSYDPYGNIASYLWTQTAGRPVTLNGANTMTPSFIAPSGISSDTLLTFKLTVTDKAGANNTDSVNITVKYACPYVQCIK
jgi:hypothetical protein